MRVSNILGSLEIGRRYINRYKAHEVYSGGGEVSITMNAVIYWQSTF